MTNETGDFFISQLKLCNRRRHAYEVKQRPNTHLRGRPKKVKLDELGTFRAPESCALFKHKRAHVSLQIALQDIQKLKKILCSHYPKRIKNRNESKFNGEFFDQIHDFVHGSSFS
jgi:hypothetical protein